MTLAEHLSLPVEKRIKRYEAEFKWGSPDGPPADQHFGNPYKDSELYEYVLYRLKREEFERTELAKQGIIV